MSAKETWLQGRIARCEDIAPAIRLIEIEVDGGAEPWQPGAHLGVRVQCEGRTEDRHYSLLDLGQEQDEGGRYRIAVKRMDGGLGGSKYMWSLVVGDTVEVTQPRDDFELGLDAPAYVFLAGGIGITALLSMARKVSHRGTPLQFHYAVRSRAEAVFADGLRALIGDALHLHVSVEGGRIDVARLVAESPANAECYVCGPLGMLEAVQAAWRAAGRPPERLRFESFGSGGHQANRPFTVTLPRYGLELPVPAHQSLLATLEAAGVELLSGCRRGECGLCAVDVLECDASLDHRDVFFSEAEKAAGTRLCTCVSRPTGGKIVIDTDYRGRNAQMGS